jgi:hypothetical protein
MTNSDARFLNPQRLGMRTPDDKEAEQEKHESAEIKAKVVVFVGSSILYLCVLSRMNDCGRDITMFG